MPTNIVIPQLISTLPIPRSLPQAKLPVQRKARPSPPGLSLLVSCVAPTRSLVNGDSLRERARGAELWEG